MKTLIVTQKEGERLHDFRTRAAKMLLRREYVSVQMKVPGTKAAKWETFTRNQAKAHLRGVLVELEYRYWKAYPLVKQINKILRRPEVELRPQEKLFKIKNLMREHARGFNETRRIIRLII